MRPHEIIVDVLDRVLQPHWILLALIATCGSIYYFSPQWATDAGLGTHELYQQREIADCEKLLDREVNDEVIANTVIVHEAGQPLSSEALADWTPQRVEARFDSGLAVVSTLGQNGNLQTIVRDLHLPVGTVFRVLNGQIKEVM